MNTWKLGIAPINWSNDDLRDLGGDTPLDRCLSEMAAAGYQGTELGHKFPTEAAALEAVLKRHRLALASCWHSTFFVAEHDPRKQLEALDRRLELLAAVGTTVINLAECSGTVHGDRQKPLSARPRFSDLDFRHLADGLQAAGERCLRRGIRPAYHHHLGTGVQDEAEIERLLELTDPALLSLCYDTGHLAAAGVDPLAFASRHESRIAHVHCKDVRPAILAEVKERNLSFLEAVLRGLFTVPGDGMIEFGPIIALLEERSYDGWLIVEAEQDPRVADPLRYALAARNYLLGVAEHCDNT
ncbi:MAG: myo-inosose-2 dehydratase [Deltaproteobacteria bacterium RIFOXYA12_FULL_61_11]|nr:MAG: myo-inosose-2 dehydratase [Deltaproteobacteria bacterium RIFOXYA12_FULL_61_11]